MRPFLTRHSYIIAPHSCTLRSLIPQLEELAKKMEDKIRIVKIDTDDYSECKRVRLRAYAEARLLANARTCNYVKLLTFFFGYPFLPQTRR